MEQLISPNINFGSSFSCPNCRMSLEFTENAFDDYFRGHQRICEKCKKTEVIEGTLAGVSFESTLQHKKWLSSGVYGIKAMVCSGCGHISNLSLDVEALKKINPK